MRKEIIKYLPIYLPLFVLSLVCAYKILVTQKQIFDEYHDMYGTVTWVTFAPRSGIYLCGIRLDDGTYGEVNWGSSPISVGDRVKNDMQYSYIMGLCGLAYGVEPKETPGILWSMGYMFLFLLPIVYLLATYLVYEPIKWWIKQH